MSKYPCKLIEDLLPLYIEDDVSDETKEIIEAHLKECENCRKLVQEYSNDDIVIEDLKQDLPKAKTYKKSMKKLKKWSIISAVSLILIVLVIGVVGYNIGKPKEDLLTQRTIVKTLEKQGVELKEDKSKSAEEYELGGVTPKIFSVGKDDGTLLIYTFKSIGERVDALDSSKIPYNQYSLRELSFTAKNAILVYTIDENPVTEDEWRNIGETVDLISDIIFEHFNDGKVMVFKGESESWEGTYTVKYYEYWWNDDNGTLKREGYAEKFPEIHYKLSDIDSIGIFDVEYKAGLSAGSTTGEILDNDGNLRMGYSGSKSAGVNVDDEITFTIKWNGKEEIITMKVE